VHPNTKSRLLRALSTRPGETAARWLRRAECQIAFARSFAALFPDQAGDWATRIDEAQALLDGLDPSEGLFGLSNAVREAEKRMAPLGEAAKKYTIHCVGHGHIDMNWMWSWPETVAATHDTFASVLSLMDQYPDLTYSQSQASVYALTEKYQPEMFERIRERVKEGRWEVSAVHWVEGDKNIASGESLCRHLLYTRRYLAEKFGLTAADAPLDWEPDTFGHANTIPNFLAQAGVRFYYSCRTGGGFDHSRTGDGRPKLFWWQGTDGSRVLVNRESTWYNSYVNIGDNIALPAVAFWRDTGLTGWLNVYGIGNHGGGPTRTEIDYYIEMRDWPVYPNVVFGTARGWFEAAEKEIADHDLLVPTIDHELNFEFTGCYTSQSLIKQANRFGENYLEEAETLAALSSRLQGKPYPRELLRDAWINILFNQFHDILPGSGVRQTREHALALFQETGAATGSIKRAAGLALASNIDTLALLPDTPEAAEERVLHASGAANTPFVAGAGIHAMESGYSVASGGGRRFLPFVIYNPCAWDRSEPVTVTLYDTDFDPARIVARDENGVNHPVHLLGRGSDWGHNKITVMFLARDVPALGYRTVVFCEGAPDAADEPTVSVSDNGTFETPHLQLRYDRFQCGFPEVIDKRNGVRFTDPFEVPMGAWEYVVERPRGMTAWALGGEVDPPAVLKSTGYAVHGIARNEGTSAASGGGIACRIEQTLEVPGTNSTVRVSTVLHGLEPRIDITAEVDWREIGDPKRGIPGLLVRFPVDFSSLSLDAHYETPFGTVERDLFGKEEVPTLRYAHLSATGIPEGARTLDGVPVGFTLLQDCKYGHSLEANDLRMRVIRSSFDPDPTPEVNKQTLRYSLYFHDRAAPPAERTRLGAAWNHPLIVFPANLQSGDGTTPPARSFVHVETPNVVLTALKQPEDGDGLILRLAELNGAADTEAVVTLDPALTAGLTTAQVTDLMEQPVADGATVTLDGDRLCVPVRANSFVTVKLT
jgi:alpha-mannosidase